MSRLCFVSNNHSLLAFDAFEIKNDQNREGWEGQPPQNLKITKKKKKRKDFSIRRSACTSKQIAQPPSSTFVE